MRRGSLFAGFATAVVLCGASSARADTHVEAQLLGFTAPVFADRAMHVGQNGDSIDMIDKAGDVRLKGNGMLDGGALRGLVHCDRLRIGFEEALFLSTGLDVTTGSLPAGFSVDHGKIWGFRFELSIGRDLVAADAPKDAIAPYVDLRLGVGFLTTSMQLHSEQWGALGNVSYQIWAPYFGPRFGVRVPLGELGFTDFSGTLNVFGLERGSLNAGLGVYL